MEACMHTCIAKWQARGFTHWPHWLMRLRLLLAQRGIQQHKDEPAFHNDGPAYEVHRCSASVTIKL
jgi:hypothetical protein